MRRFILAATAIAGLAVPALAPALASASVPRCQAPVTSATQASFSVFQPAGQVGQWDNVWQHDINVTVAPDGTFSGTGTEYNQDHSVTLGETITGQRNPDGTVNLTGVREDGVKWSLDHATADATSKDAGAVNYATSDPVVGWQLEVRLTPLKFEVVTTTDLNHGQYVSAQGGGKVAAQSCAGMPLNSAQGK